MLRELLRQWRGAKPTNAPPAPAPAALPLETAVLPPGATLVDARFPVADRIAGARLLPAQILFFHLSELPEPLCIVAEDPHQARRIARRLRQCGHRAWAWTGEITRIPCSHRGRQRAGAWVYAETDDRLFMMNQDQTGLWTEELVLLAEAGTTT